jgi:hypothetical protein
VCWENGKIVSLKLYGPKCRTQDEIIPEMKEYSLKIGIGACHLWQRCQESGEEFTRSRIDH